MDRKTKTLLIADLILLVICIITVATSWAEKTGIEAWVMCQPDSYVNVRKRPSSKSESIGRYETGDKVWLTGEMRDGYAYSNQLALEDNEGWISTGYLVYDEPEWKDGASYTVRSNGRVALRRSIEGSRTSWVKDGTKLKVYWYSEEWCCTSRGVIRTEYLVEEGNKDGQ